MLGKQIRTVIYGNLLSPFRISLAKNTADDLKLNSFLWLLLAKSTKSKMTTN